MKQNSDWDANTFGFVTYQTSDLWFHSTNAIIFLNALPDELDRESLSADT